MTMTIPASALTAFITALQKLNRRAARIGCDPLTIASTASSVVKFEGVEFPALTIEIEGESPSFAGWNFVASVESLDTGKNIFHGDTAGIPSRFAFTGHSCEHCNQNRKRNSSFILRNGENFMQVGSTCINDFLGGNYLPVFSFLSNAREILRDFESFGNASIDSVSVITTLSAAAATIRENGFVKKTGYEGDGPRPTALLVESFLCDVRNPKRFIPTITDADEAKAEAVRDWLVNHEGTQSDYLQKLIDLAAASVVSIRNIGILASAIASYDREVERKTQALASPSSHVGTVGKRETFVVSLTGCKVLPDYGYGCSNLYSFKDEHGNVLKWKTQGNFNRSDTFKITGSVKKHSEWNGVKETELTRCKMS